MTAQAAPLSTAADPPPQTVRCVIVVDQELPPGLAANAAGVLALTLGATVDGLAGADAVDADGEVHPGLIPMGLPVLAAPRGQLGDLRARAVDAGVGVIDFPTFGQQTTDYEAFRALVAQTRNAELEYLGVALHGPRRAIARLTGNLRLLR
jgi:FAD/FMN-containing dehydrogenase